MFASCADGTLLPPCVCYKAAHLYEVWTVGGPPGTRCNRSASGWFEMHTVRLKIGLRPLCCHSTHGLKEKSTGRREPQLPLVRGSYHKM